MQYDRIAQEFVSIRGRDRIDVDTVGLDAAGEGYVIGNFGERRPNIAAEPLVNRARPASWVLAPQQMDRGRVATVEEQRPPGGRKSGN